MKHIIGSGATSLSDSELPERTMGYLENGAPEGSRNNELHAACCQVRDHGMWNKYEAALLQRALNDGLSESEANRTMASAFRGEQREPCMRGSGTGATYRLNGSSAAAKPPEVKPFVPVSCSGDLPNELDGTAPIEFLRRIFKPDDIFCLSFPGSGGKPTEDYKASIALLDTDPKVQAYCQKVLDGASDGGWFCINPLKDLNSARADANVADFRHLLVELDGTLNRPDLWPEEKKVQFANLKATRLPIVAIYDSGGKSIHALVKVAAKDADEFKQRRQVVYAYLGKLSIDVANKNPSRLSRIPGVMRGPRKQHLLSWSIGAANWQEWEAANPDDGLPDIESPRSFLSAREALDPYLIEGLLRGGSKMNISSQSKLFKTWLMIHLALCVGSGRPWLGHETYRAPVLYINFELKHNTMNNRVLDICDAMSLNPVSGHDVDFWNLRGKPADIKVMVDKILRRLKTRPYKFVIVDPAYKCLGDRDDNSARDVTDFCNHVERISAQTGAATLIVGHSTKGEQAGRLSNDIQSGSAVWSRDPDVVASFLKCTDAAINNQYGEDRVIDIRFSGMREDATPAPFAAIWEYPLYRRLSGLIPEAGSGNRSEWGPRDILSLLQKGPLFHKKWKAQAEIVGINPTRFNRLLKKCKGKQVDLNDEKKYQLTPKGLKELAIPQGGMTIVNNVKNMSKMS